MYNNFHIFIDVDVFSCKKASQTKIINFFMRAFIYHQKAHYTLSQLLTEINTTKKYKIYERLNLNLVHTIQVTSIFLLH